MSSGGEQGDTTRRAAASAVSRAVSDDAFHGVTESQCVLERRCGVERSDACCRQLVELATVLGRQRKGDDAPRRFRAQLKREKTDLDRVLGGGIVKM